jgi:hypothetical protein
MAELRLKNWTRIVFVTPFTQYFTTSNCMVTAASPFGLGPDLTTGAVRWGGARSNRASTSLSVSWYQKNTRSKATILSFLLFKIPILRPPTLNERHSYRAHPGQLVHGLEPLADRLRQKSCEFLIVEYFQIATWNRTQRSHINLSNNVAVLLTTGIW